MYSKLAYDVFRDLAPVTRIAAVQNVLVVHPDVPARTVKELIALAKAKPGTLNFASPGNGSQAHVAVELLKMQLGLDLVHVPYQGVGPAIKDLLGGRIQLMIAQVPVGASAHQGRNAAGARRRERRPLDALPGVPTIAAAAELPGFEAVSWYALMAPAGTPRGCDREDSRRRREGAADAGRARAPRRDGRRALGRIARRARRAHQGRVRPLG